MDRKKIIIGLIILLLFVFVAPLFINIAFFDFQCHEGGCSGQLCSSTPKEYGRFTHCAVEPEFGCLGECEVRWFSCSNRAEGSEACIACVDECQKSEDINPYECAKENCWTLLTKS